MRGRRFARMQELAGQRVNVCEQCARELQPDREQISAGQFRRHARGARPRANPAKRRSAVGRKRAATSSARSSTSTSVGRKRFSTSRCADCDAPSPSLVMCADGLWRDSGCRRAWLKRERLPEKPIAELKRIIAQRARAPIQRSPKPVQVTRAGGDVDDEDLQDDDAGDELRAVHVFGGAATWPAWMEHDCPSCPSLEGCHCVDPVTLEPRKNPHAARRKLARATAEGTNPAKPAAREDLDADELARVERRKRAKAAKLEEISSTPGQVTLAAAAATNPANGVGRKRGERVIEPDWLLRGCPVRGCDAPALASCVRVGTTIPRKTPHPPRTRLKRSRPSGGRALEADRRAA